MRGASRSSVRRPRVRVPPRRPRFPPSRARTEGGPPVVSPGGRAGPVRRGKNILLGSRAGLGRALEVAGLAAARLRSRSSAGSRHGWSCRRRWPQLRNGRRRRDRVVHRQRRRRVPARRAQGRQPFRLPRQNGNMAEWVEDCWNGGHAGAPPDGRASASGGSSAAAPGLTTPASCARRIAAVTCPTGAACTGSFGRCGGCRRGGAISRPASRTARRRGGR